MEWILFAIAVVIISKTPIGAALVERIRSGGGGRLGGAARSGAGGQLEELETRLTGELEALRQDVVELQERMDFVERALTAARRSDALPGRG